MADSRRTAVVAPGQALGPRAAGPPGGALLGLRRRVPGHPRPAHDGAPPRTAAPAPAVSLGRVRVAVGGAQRCHGSHAARLWALLRGSKTDPQRPLPTDPLTTDSVRRRPTKLSHLIEDVTCEDGLRLLPRPTARSKALPDDQLVPEEGVLHTGLLMVAGLDPISWTV